MSKRKLDGRVLFGVFGLLAMEILIILTGFEQESMIITMTGTMLVVGLALFGVFILAGKEEKNKKVAIRLLVAVAFVAIEAVLLIALIFMVQGGAY